MSSRKDGKVVMREQHPIVEHPVRHSPDSQAHRVVVTDPSDLSKNNQTFFAFSQSKKRIEQSTQEAAPQAALGSLILAINQGNQANIRKIIEGRQYDDTLDIPKSRQVLRLRELNAELLNKEHPSLVSFALKRAAAAVESPREPGNEFALSYLITNRHQLTRFSCNETDEEILAYARQLDAQLKSKGLSAHLESLVLSPMLTDGAAPAA